MMRLAACLSRHLPSAAEPRRDGQLLSDFLSRRDEAAFAELVRRHGPLVWAASRRLLPNPSDAEDAFQAAFLVLIRRAARLADREALGPWLYRVAIWTARNMRRRNARALARQVPMSPAAAHPGPGAEAFDRQADIDAALLSIPEKYRAPLVLCYLQGWPRREAALRLGCPEGTLSSLLARGLDRLRVKLKGLDPTKALALGTSTVPFSLANATVKTAAGVQLASAFALSTTASQLAEGVIRMFWLKKATAASIALFAMFGMGVGIGVSVNRMPGAAAGDGPGTSARVTNSDSADDRSLDLQIETEKKSVQAISAVIQSAEEGIKHMKRRLAASEKSGTPAEAEADHNVLARFQRNLEDAQKQRYKVAVRLQALQALKRKQLNEGDELQKLREQLEAVRKKINKAHEDMGAMFTLADAKDQKAREEAMQLIARGYGAFAELQKLEKELSAKIEAQERKVKPLPQDARKEATVRLDDWTAGSLDEMKRIEARLEQLKVQEDVLKAQTITLNVDREQLKLKLAELEKRRAEANGKLPPLAFKGYLDLTILGKDGVWAYSVREFGANGKPVGTVVFDSMEMLSRFLRRTGTDAAGPKEVLITVQGDATLLLKDFCKSAGLQPPASVKQGKYRSTIVP